MGRIMYHIEKREYWEREVNIIGRFGQPEMRHLPANSAHDIHFTLNTIHFFQYSLIHDSALYKSIK